MATYIPLKMQTFDDRGGNHFALYWLQYDSTISTVVEVDEHIVDAAVLYGELSQTKPTVTVSQNGSSSSITLSGGTSGEVCIVGRFSGGGASL